MHDTSSLAYLVLRLVHILGSVVMLGAFATAITLKLAADRVGDAGRIAGLHAALARVDGRIVGPSAFLSFAAGYAMIRFLGGRIGQHWFSILGLMLLTLAVGAWYFGTRKLNPRLATEADASHLNRQPLGPDYGRLSAAWMLWTGIASLALIVAAFVMVFRDRLGIG